MSSHRAEFQAQGGEEDNAHFRQVELDNVLAYDEDQGFQRLVTATDRTEYDEMRQRLIEASKERDIGTYPENSIEEIKKDIVEDLDPENTIEEVKETENKIVEIESELKELEILLEEKVDEDSENVAKDEPETNVPGDTAVEEVMNDVADS